MLGVKRQRSEGDEIAVAKKENTSENLTETAVGGGKKADIYSDPQGQGACQGSERKVSAGAVTEAKGAAQPTSGEGAQEDQAMGMETNGSGNGEDVHIDEDLHSRQLAVYGRESMRKMASARVLVHGMCGLGCEVAKNVILAGVRMVTVHDDKVVSMKDLSSQFYLQEGDVGKSRSEACKDSLQELNTAVGVNASTGKLLDEVILDHEVVVMIDAPLSEATRVNELCRSQSPAICFIYGSTMGVVGNVFCDFGPEFTCLDVDGEEPVSAILSGISVSEGKAMVTCIDDERLEFDDGMSVTFSEIKGMEELNDGKPRKIKNVKPHSFELDDEACATYQPYTTGGIVTQFKEPKTLNFKSMSEALRFPGEFLISDFAKMERSGVLHVGMQAIDRFVAESGGDFPQPHSEEDIARVISIAREVDSNMPEEHRLGNDLDEAVLKKFAQTAQGDLCPMAALFGGIIGQEVVKACTCKFHPLFQWFHFDSMESLPDDVPPASDLEMTGSRYDGQIALFGRDFQEKLGNSKTFVVGAGALGCEFLKNLACMGVACGQGQVTVTDDDIIEKSNLSRQFLFRNWNIGQSKSIVATAAAQAINRNFSVKALQNRVSPETEEVFDDKFWESLDFVINALDNVTARLYVDSRCVYFQKALLESGTLGPKCNTQMVVPNLTENYGASRDPPEKQAPMCTVHSFPHNIDHCLTWARSEFEGMLESAPSEANAFLSDPNREEFLSKARETGDAAARESLEKIVDCLVDNQCSTYEQCISWARHKLQDYFHNRIAQLVYTFPEDYTTSSGAPFWSPPKRFPRALDFSAKDDLHVSFVQAAANLKAEVHGITLPAWASDKNAVGKVASAVDVPPFAPRVGVKIETDPKAKTTPIGGVDDDSIIDQLIQKLSSRSFPADMKLCPIQFEKDDDTNYHMDMIAGLANLRARNYGIDEVDKLKAKFIAGRIIPAIATATAMATGLVCLELYKIILQKPIESYRNTFANLALPLFAMAEPIDAKSMTFKDLKWTLWDRWIINEDITIKGLLDWFDAKSLIAYSISCGPTLMYNSMFPKHRERLDKKVSELAETIAKVALPKSRRHVDLVVACEDEDENDVDVPIVSIVFR